MNYLQLPCEMWASVGSLSGLQLAIYCDAWTWRAQGNDSYRANSSLAEMFGVNERAIPRAVSKLVELGLVTTERRPDGRRAIIPVAPDQPVTRPIRQVTNRSGDQPVREGVTNLSGGDCPTGQGGGDQLVNQEENITNQLIEQREEKKEREKKIEIVMPWPSDEFAQMWQEWKDYKKAEHRFTYKSPRTEQATLHKLQQDAKDNEQLAIFAITKSITSGWKGLFINSKLQGEFNSTHASTAGGDWTEAEFRHWAKTGEMPVNHF